MVTAKPDPFWSEDNDMLCRFRWALLSWIWWYSNLLQLCSYEFFYGFLTEILWVLEFFNKKMKHKHLHFHPPLIETRYIIYVNWNWHFLYSAPTCVIWQHCLILLCVGEKMGVDGIELIGQYPSNSFISLDCCELMWYHEAMPCRLIEEASLGKFSPV